MGHQEQMVSDSAAMMETALRICRGYLNGPWKKITAKDITVKRISGGLSNWLYSVSLDGDSGGANYPGQVLLRLYGQTHGEGALESIITESVIFTLLSERKLGPALYGVFPGGRIEQFIPARPTKRWEMSSPCISDLVAEKMAAIHTMNVPISKEPSWVWNTMNKWLRSISDWNKENDVNPSLNANNCTYKKLKSEVSWLKRHLSTVPSPVVFCHNDLQGGNILLRQDTSHCEVVIIDFEYCSYNYRGFDLANHFIEWAYDYSHPDHPNFTVDSNNQASLQQMKQFVETYLRCLKESTNNNNSKLVNASNVDGILNEIKHYSLASHLFWALWSFVNAKVSQIPFGYHEYAEERLRRYYELKGEVVGGRE